MLLGGLSMLILRLSIHIVSVEFYLLSVITVFLYVCMKLYKERLGDFPDYLEAT